MSGCGVRKSEFLHETYRTEYQARLVDIPFPFDAQIQDQDFQDSTKNNDLILTNEDKVKFFITCITNTSLSDLQKLYHSEMELLGWFEVAYFDTNPDELLFIFEKPYKKCIITAQTRKNKVKVTYYITRL